MPSQQTSCHALRKSFIWFSGLAAFTALLWWTVPRINFSGEKPGIVLDSLDGVYVYNNGAFSAVRGRNLSQTGYNIGLEYQCVEFVKRYYLYRYAHEMPDSYGHARDFFDASVEDGEINPARGLLQYRNGSAERPREGDILVFGSTFFNRFGHVAIISAAGPDGVEVIQQNVGSRTRTTYSLTDEKGVYRIGGRSVKGWLRMKEL